MTCCKVFDMYIAIPYTHEDPAIRQQRYHRATVYLAKVTEAGLVGFSPITHSHPLGFFDLPTDWDFWSQIDLRIITACKELHVVCMPGWSESTGVSAEIEKARELNMPIIYFDPEDYEPINTENCDEE